MLINTNTNHIESKSVKYCLKIYESEVLNNTTDFQWERYQTEHIIPQAPYAYKLNKMNLTRHVHRIGNLVLIEAKMNGNIQSSLLNKEMFCYLWESIDEYNESILKYKGMNKYDETKLKYPNFLTSNFDKSSGIF